MNDLVTIILPSYNAEKFISATIDSVLSQTFENWELEITDDCSTDSTVDIITKYVKRDERIHLWQLDKNSGVSVARNNSIKKARGRFIAFIDSDDIWLPDKLADQVNTWKQAGPNVAIVYSNYEKMNEDGQRNNRIITAPGNVTYNQLLNGNVITCSTAMYDTQKVGKVYIKNIPHEDYVLWLTILKQGFSALNTQKVSAIYRIRNGSISANKFKTIVWQWNIYRKEERLNMIRSFYHFVHYAVKAFSKAIK